MKLPVYLGLLEHAEDALADAFVQVADGHSDEPDVHSLCHLLAKQCRDHQEALRPVIDLAGFVDVTWTLVAQAAQGLQDADLLAVVHGCEGETALQVRWLLGRMKQAVPQALIVG